MQISGESSQWFAVRTASGREKSVAGQLQAMKRVGVNDFNTALMNPGDVIDVAWVNVSAATPRKCYPRRSPNKVLHSRKRNDDGLRIPVPISRWRALPHRDSVH
jgi:hypothetical protein